MKIVFLCGCLEEGRDGVGDYSRRLAEACGALGVEAALLAINDGFIERTSGAAFLRLPRREPWRARHARAAEFLTAQRPDWVSVQLVSYALEPDGVIFRWGPRLAELLRGRRVHLMFHELWIGESTEYGLKDRLFGAMQKASIRRHVQHLRPAAMHTSHRLYQQMLAEIGVCAGRLPLPGNIPLHLDATTPPPAALHGLDRERCWLGGIFGTIHARWQPEPWLAELCARAEEAGRRLMLVRFGEVGAGGRKTWERMAADYGARADFIAYGPLAAPEIAGLLHALDFGIATSPWALIEKSGSTAAFLDRGLPVLVPRDDWQRRSGRTVAPAANPLLVRTTAALVRAPRRAPAARLPEIARRLLHELRAA